MPITFWGRTTLAVAILAMATACSVADYEKPVTDFAAATRNAEKALVALDAQVTDAYAAVRRERALGGLEHVEFKLDDCELGSQRCRLQTLDQSQETRTLAPESLLPDMVVLMQAIRAYADNLTAIVKADTAAQVAVHVNAAVGSAENLAATITELRPEEDKSSPDLSEYATPLGKAVNWLVGQYIAKVQLDGLERATAAADPVIARAAQVFAKTAQYASDVTRSSLATDVSEKIDEFRANRSESNLTALVAAASAYDRMLVAKPSSAFAQLGVAHNALTRRLQNDGLSLAEAMAKIEAFANEIGELTKIVKELAEVGEE